MIEKHFRLRSHLGYFFLIFFLLCSPCYAGGGPENVLLVVNANSLASRTVANYYIDARKLPPNNVYYLNFPAGKGSIPGSLFRRRILTPIFKEVDKRKLDGQIDYVVYSCDFPWRIDFRREFPGEVFSKANTPVLSLTSATYLFAFVEQKRKEMFALNSNFYCSPPANLMVISRSLRSSYRWSLGGRRAGQEGLPYMLSAMLGVEGTPGNTVNEMAWYLGRAAAADGTSPPGTIYYAVNRTVRSSVRDQGFADAVRQVQLSGVKAQIVQDFFPKYKQDVAGVTCGHSKIDVVAAQVRFLPGAFCDNLTSSGGQFISGKKQTNLSDFLRSGAAGACGTVVEPLALPQKFPNNTLHVHYVHGCSLAESFYQSVAAPFQQILVGDPLCQPWAKMPKVTLAGLADGGTVKGPVSITPTATNGSPVASFQLFVDGVAGPKCSPGEQLTWDTTKTEDGHHEIRVVATDSTPIETQGRWLGWVAVKNGKDAVELNVDESSLKATANMLTVTAATTDGAAITVFGNGIEVGKLPEGSGSLTIDKQKLGAGPIAFVAVTSGKPGVRSRPVRVVLEGSKS